MTKLHCDICGGVMTQQDELIRVDYNHYSGFNRDNGRVERRILQYKKLEICSVCNNKIKDFVEKLSKNGENCAEKV